MPDGSWFPIALPAVECQPLDLGSVVHLWRDGQRRMDDGVVVEIVAPRECPQTSHKCHRWAPNEITYVVMTERGAAVRTAEQLGVIAL